MNKFSIIGDTSSKIAFVLDPPIYVDAYVLSANIPINVPVPEGAGVVVFSTTDDFYTNWRGTATVPTENITDGTASELNPGARYLAGINMFSIVSATAVKVTMQFYEV